MSDSCEVGQSEVLVKILKIGREFEGTFSVWTKGDLGIEFGPEKDRVQAESFSLFHVGF